MVHSFAAVADLLGERPSDCSISQKSRCQASFDVCFQPSLSQADAKLQPSFDQTSAKGQPGFSQASARLQPGFSQAFARLGSELGLGSGDPKGTPLPARPCASGRRASTPLESTTPTSHEHTSAWAVPDRYWGSEVAHPQLDSLTDVFARNFPPSRLSPLCPADWSPIKACPPLHLSSIGHGQSVSAILPRRCKSKTTEKR